MVTRQYQKDSVTRQYQQDLTAPRTPDRSPSRVDRHTLHRHNSMAEAAPTHRRVCLAMLTHTFESAGAVGCRFDPARTPPKPSAVTLYLHLHARALLSVTTQPGTLPSRHVPGALDVQQALLATPAITGPSLWSVRSVLRSCSFLFVLLVGVSLCKDHAPIGAVFALGKRPPAVE